MSKIAFISDIHGNYLALLEVLNDIEKRGVTEIHCLGDIALKYVDPKDTTDVIRSECKSVIQGNVDNHFAQIREVGKDILPLNKKYCGEENLRYLRELPFAKDIFLNGFHIRLLHASPRSFDRLYNPKTDNSTNTYKDKIITDTNEFFEHTCEIEKFVKKEDGCPDIVIFGHTHVPTFEKIESKYLINPGSVGDPFSHFRKKAKLDKFNNPITNEDGKFIFEDVPVLEKEISYLIVDDNPSKKDELNFELIRIPYVDLLKKVKERVLNSKLVSNMNKNKINDSNDYVNNKKIPLKGNETWKVRR